MINKQTNVEGLGVVAQSDGNLLTNVQDLKRLISLRDEAFCRINAGIGKIDGTRVSMVVNYLKGESPVLVRGGMTQRLAKYLVNANLLGKYYSTGSDEQYEKARHIADKQESIAPEKRTAIVCPSRNSFNMSPTENKTHFDFAFQDQAQRYFDKIGCPITFYPIDARVVDGNPGTILNYLWFGGLGGRSGLVGDYRGAFNCSSRARGVLGASQKISESHSYTEKQLDVMIKTAEGIVQGRFRMSDLESKAEGIAQFLKSLKQ